MNYDILTVGQFLPLSGGTVTRTGSFSTGYGNGVFEITSTGQQAFDDAMEYISDAAPVGGADIVVAPSSTGKYTFTGYANIDQSARIWWPAGTYLELGGFRGFAFSKANSGIHGLWVNDEISGDDTKYVWVTDNGVDGATDNFFATNCRFQVGIANGNDASKENYCILVEGNSPSEEEGGGVYLTSGLYINNNSFEFANTGQQALSYVGADRHGITGISVENRRHAFVYGNSFKGNQATLETVAPNNLGRCHAAFIAKNMIFSKFIGNGIFGLDSRNAATSGVGVEFASDLVYVEKATANEAHHSVYTGNTMELCAARYGWNFDECIYTRANFNMVGRTTCRGAVRVSGNGIDYRGWDLHNIQPITTGHVDYQNFFQGYHILEDDVSNSVSGSDLYNIKSNQWHGDDFHFNNGVANPLSFPSMTAPGFMR